MLCALVAAALLWSPLLLLLLRLSMTLWMQTQTCQQPGVVLALLLPVCPRLYWIACALLHLLLLLLLLSGLSLKLTACECCLRLLQLGWQGAPQCWTASLGGAYPPAP
jgi:hypothetical protein